MMTPSGKPVLKRGKVITTVVTSVGTNISTDEDALRIERIDRDCMAQEPLANQRQPHPGITTCG